MIKMNDKIEKLDKEVADLHKRVNDFETELENGDNSYSYDREIITGTIKETQEEIQSLTYANNTLTKEVTYLRHEVSQLIRKLNDVDNRLYSVEGQV